MLNYFESEQDNKIQKRKLYKKSFNLVCLLSSRDFAKFHLNMTNEEMLKLSVEPRYRYKSMLIRGIADLAPRTPS